MSLGRGMVWLVFLVSLVACGAAQPPSVDPVLEGERLFRVWCIGCHSLDPDGPTALGPSLAGVATRAANNDEGLTAAEWLYRETVNPNAVVTPGYSPGLMPSDYERALRPDQLEALVAYMLTLE
ncbi:cytochrome c [Candidatus Chloroploca sp. M-50]|uniref:Cytochrome c n=1 Tax=Candidatus Chloroploca mongolica TaxID=2528176 RepID=A0ABS4DAQ8_9CHLR|nr:cytochrome c [Candidatus Chloroploca mongolica]MBP1466518.1 cytochrome c [Candidatus Chloroploca mongolica]